MIAQRRQRVGSSATPPYAAIAPQSCATSTASLPPPKAPCRAATSAARALASFTAFEKTWDSVEDLVRERSREAYDGIEGAMPTIENALKEPTPDAKRIATLVVRVMNQYNAVVAQVMKEAREARQNAA